MIEKLYKFNELNLIDKYNILSTIKYIIEHPDKKKIIDGLELNKIYYKHCHFTINVDNYNLSFIEISDIYILTNNIVKYIDFIKITIKILNKMLIDCKRLLKINKILNK